MIKIIHSFVLLSIIPFYTQAQVISQFNWNSNPVTKAAVGPDATYLSVFAVSSPGGVGGTNGLNAGLGRHDIDMIMPGTPFVSQPGLDISVDFRKEENDASFFLLGGLDFGINGGSLYIKYLLNVSGTNVPISANNLYDVADALFHTYRFVYNSSTGKATASVDGATVYTYQAAAGTTLSWTGAGTATIGGLMDGGNSNIPVLDNLIIQKPGVLLPLDLLSFDAHTGNAGNELLWTTAHEVNTRHFIIERSSDGIQFQTIGIVAAQQNYSGNTHYQFTDNAPSSVNFYRLKMVDADGSFSYSAVKKLSSAASVSISCYPNPVVDYVNVRIGQSSGPVYYSLVTLDGKVMQSGKIQADAAGQSVSLNLSAASKGIYLVRVQQEDMTGTQTFKILKQ